MDSCIAQPGWFLLPGLESCEDVTSSSWKVKSERRGYFHRLSTMVGNIMSLTKGASGGHAFFLR